MIDLNVQSVKKFFDKYKVITVLTVLLLLTLIVMVCATDRCVLRIEGTGLKEEASWGTDIRITDIYVNDIRLTESDVKLSGQWESADGQFTAIGTDESTWIEISFRATDWVRICFWKQEGSGYINILRDGKLVENQNLYAPVKDTAVYTQERDIQSAPLQQLLPFLLLLECAALEYQLLRTFLSRIKVEKRKGKVIPIVLHPVLLLLGAAVLYLCAEVMGGNWRTMSLTTAEENILLYYAVMLVIYLVTSRVSWSVGVVSVVWLIFAVANYYVTAFRGSPITPGDFLVLETAANVAGNYQYTLTKGICCGLIAFVFFFAIICAGEKVGSAWKGIRRVILCIPAIVLGMVILNSGIYHKNMDLWDLKNNVSKYGLGVNLVSSLYNMQVDAPEDFSAEKAAEILEQYEQEDSGFRPNIIVVMNEAFSDLSVVNEALNSDLYMPYFNSLQENTVKGTAISSVYGGTTANSEYEFLTGNSMFFMKNHVPYQQHIFQDTDSLVGELKDRGYCTVAIHPYLASGYSRPRVYSCFGFDDFLSIDDFSDYELIRDLYISDRDSYKKVIEVFEEIQETESPAFIFNVTMQNHSTYQSGFFQDDVVRVPGYEGVFPEVEEYLTLIRESDAALAVLIDYFSQVEEPTIICMFGDHQPAVEMSYYETCFGKKQSAFTRDETVKMYEVPFMIWANYDIEEETGIYSSLNYLSAILMEKTGMTCTPYQNYLLQLRQSFTVICKLGCIDYNGNVYSSNSLEDLPEQLKEYWGLEYHAIFDTTFK